MRRVGPFSPGKLAGDRRNLGSGVALLGRCGNDVHAHTRGSFLLLSISAYSLGSPIILVYLFLLSMPARPTDRSIGPAYGRSSSQEPDSRLRRPGFAFLQRRRSALRVAAWRFLGAGTLKEDGPVVTGERRVPFGIARPQRFRCVGDSQSGCPASAPNGSGRRCVCALVAQRGRIQWLAKDCNRSRD